MWVIVKGANNYYAVNIETWNHINEQTKEIPSELLSEHIEELLKMAGSKIPENVGAHQVGKTYMKYGRNAVNTGSKLCMRSI